MSKKLAVAAAVVACFINEFAKGLYAGFLHGASVMCQTYYPVWKNGVRDPHADPYFDLVRMQQILFLALLLFIGGKLAERGLVSKSLTFLPLIVGLLLCLGIEIEKIREFRGKWDLSDESVRYLELLKETTYYTWIVLSLVCGLIIIQMSDLLKSLAEKRRAASGYPGGAARRSP